MPDPPAAPADTNVTPLFLKETAVDADGVEHPIWFNHPSAWAGAAARPEVVADAEVVDLTGLGPVGPVDPWDPTPFGGG